MRLIDADALIKTIERKDICTYTDTAGNTYGESDVIEYIESMPTIDHVRHGHWDVFIHSAYYGVDETGEPIFRDKRVFYCSDSKCRRKTVVKEKFCPNCGAKMDEE